MSEYTKIQWAHHTWSPWIGCTKVHAGCTNCYAEADMAIRRKRVVWGEGGHRSRTSNAYWKTPIKWNREAEKAEEFRRVFPSLCDPFDDHPDVEAWRQDMFRLIDRTPHLDWLLLTKRPGNIRAMWPREGFEHNNVWLVYSASNQETLDQGAFQLLSARNLTSVLGLSLEPLLAQVDMGRYIDGLDWVIVGGESGQRARQCNLAWVRSVIDQCNSSNVPVFVKQLGSFWAKSCNASDRKGGDPDEWPADLRTRLFPSVCYAEKAI